MPSEPKPKKFVAARDIIFQGKRYEVGDPVEDRRAIDRLLRYGDQFITVKRPKSASAETPAVDTAKSNTAESNKED